MQPYMPFAPLTISPDAAIDLQMYTTLSDGYWTAPTLLDHIARESLTLSNTLKTGQLDTKMCGHLYSRRSSSSGVGL